MLKRADNRFEREQYIEAIKLYTKVINKKRRNIHVAARLGDSYRLVNDTRNSERWYRAAIDAGDIRPGTVFWFAEMLRYNNKTREALDWMKRFNDLNATSDVAINRRMSADLFRELLGRERVSVNLRLLRMNSDQSDFGPAWLGQDQVVFTSSRRAPGFWERKNHRDQFPFFSMMVAGRDRGELVNIQPFAPEISSGLHHGPAVFSADGKEMFFTRNLFQRRPWRENRVNRLMIYHAVNNGQGWTNVTLLPFNSEDYSCGHPALSPDGKSLYFVSDMPGGYGETDIYVVRKQAHGTWGSPMNLGSIINTPGREMFPFVSSSGNLYFSSDGMINYGGLDLFRATPEGNSFVNLINLGVPINSPSDDFSLIIDESDMSGYLASNRRKGNVDDLYYFILTIRGPTAVPDIVQTSKFIPLVEIYPLDNDIKGTGNFFKITEFTEVTASGGRVELDTEKNLMTYLPIDGFAGRDTIHYTICDTLSLLRGCDRSFVVVDVKDDYFGLMGMVVRKGTFEPVRDVRISLQDEELKLLDQRNSTSDGTFTFNLSKDKNFSLKFRRDGFITRSVNITTVGLPPSTQSVAEIVELERLDGYMFRVWIYFEPEKDVLTNTAEQEIDSRILSFLADNPRVTLEIGVHTDSRGEAQKNLEISHKRAVAIAQYLIGKGIESRRVVPKGYGSEKLLNNCAPGVNCTDTQHAQNRRIELKVLSF